MKQKRLISIFTLVCFLLTFIPIAAFAEEPIPTSGTCGENLTWEYADGGLTISGTGEMNSYEPLSDRPWESALSNAAIGSVHVVVEEGVTSIGSSAFEGIHSIKSVELPDSLTTIGERAFGYSQSLSDVKIPKQVKYIGEMAFIGTDITSVIIPDNGVQIGEDAFEDCSKLEKLVIPASATLLGAILDDRCSNLKTAGPIGGDYNYEFDWTQEIPAYAFSGGCLETIVLPDTIISIGEDAFYECKSLKSIDLPSKLQEIQKRAFCMCTSLETLDIPDGVQKIGNYAFAVCSTLHQVTLPDSLETLGDSAFASCLRLTSIAIPDGVKQIGSQGFNNCPLLTSIYFYGDAPSVYDADSYGPSFDADTAVLYYLEGKAGWITPKWNGYQTKVWAGGPYPEQPDVSIPVIPVEPPVSNETVLTGTKPVNGATNVGYDAADLPEFHM